MSDQSTPVTRLPLRKGASLRWLPFLFIFLQSVLYGLGDPISKSAYEVLPVYSLLTARYGIALAFLLLVFGRRIWRGLKVCSPRDWLLPSLCMGGAYVANNIALELTAATSVAFLRSLSTMMTPLLALAFYRRKFGKKHIPVQLLVLVGLYLLCGLGGLSAGVGLIAGVGLLGRGLGSGADDAVLRLENHMHPLRQVGGYQGGQADAQVDHVAVLQLLGDALGNKALDLRLFHYAFPPSTM